MTTRFWLVRHGPTHMKRAIGWTDVPADLSDVVKLEALKRALPEEAVVVSSDLLRAVATAEAICGRCQRLDPDPLLREIHLGDWEGRDFDDIARSDPDLARSYWETPGAVAPPGGESWDAFSARVQAQIALLRQAHAGRDIVCVVHFGVILAAIGAARGIAPAAMMGFRIDPLSLTRLDYLVEADAWTVRWINQTW